MTVILFNILVNLGNKKIAYIVSLLMSLIYVIFPMSSLIWGFDRVFKYIDFYAVGVFLAKNRKVVDRKFEGWVVAIVLLALNFFLSYHNLTTGIMWFMTALIGVAALVLIS